VTAPADISKVLIKFLLRLCSYTIYSVVKYRPDPAYAGRAAWAAMSHLCFHNRFARDGAKIVELTCSMLGANWNTVEAMTYGVFDWRPASSSIS
jgi:hypothetical protein